MHTLNGCYLFGNVKATDRGKLEDRKRMKGRIIKKLKSISTISSLKQGLVFRANNLSEQHFQTSSFSKESQKDGSQSELVDCSSIVSEISKDDRGQERAPGQFKKIEEDFSRPPLRLQSEEGTLSDVNDTEETGGKSDSQGGSVPTITLPDQVKLSSESRTKKNEVDSLLEAGEPSNLLALDMKNDRSLSDSKSIACKNAEAKESEVVLVSLQEFEEKCPPGGNESVVVYTTSMRGIRKTFEDCNSIRFLLESFRVEYNERDVSMHLEYRDELWKIMGSRVVPPRLFIRGRYIGGADEVVGLHERGMLKKLLQGIPLTSNNCCCRGCAGVRFVLCLNCNGSRKIITGEGQGCDEAAIRCSECNENGLVKCPICSFDK